MTEPDESGRIWIQDNRIHYKSYSYGSWDVAVDELRVIGEATTGNGPFMDDYFMCFATGPEIWLEASFYATGTDELMAFLADYFKCDMKPGLIQSTSFKSRVLWPMHLREQPMFQYVPLKRDGVLGWIFDLVDKQSLQNYSDNIFEYLKSSNSKIIMISKQSKL